MEEWQKGSYQFSELSDQEKEINLLRQVSLAAVELEKSIFAELKIGEKAKILDLGCGPGFISVELAKFFPSGTVLGVDFSNKLLKLAETLRNTEKIPNLSFKQSDIYNLDPEISGFDLTYLRFVLQHLKCPLEALSSAMKTLRPGGTLCVVDIDDNYSELHPSLPALKSFNRRAVNGQAAIGGDRNIGRKLENYFSEAGLCNPKVLVKTLSSRDIGIYNLIDLIIKTRYPVIAESEQDIAEKEVEEIYSIADNPEAWGTMDIFVATGTKM